MKNVILGNALLDGHFYEAEIIFDDKIKSIKKLGKKKANLPFIIPGFIDLHLHGGGGCDVMDAKSDSVKRLASTHAQYGTTSFLATTMTAPYSNLENALHAVSAHYIARPQKAARILGIHLEGPFISTKKLGAQPDATREATLKEIDALHKIVPIKVLTLSPEDHAHIDLIKELNARHITVQIGHSNASYEVGVEALNRGAKSFTHLFNAMSSFHHRNPGVAGAALAHAQYAEIIPDLLHVHPGAIKAALRSIPDLYFVTDATAASGMPDGNYKLGTQTVHKCLGGVRLADGTLAGSALTSHQAFLNLIDLGLTIEEVSRRMSQIPAELIGISDRGILKEDCYADLLLLDEKFILQEIYIEGDKI